VLVLNVVLNLVCVRGLGMDVGGLTLSTAVTSWISLVWLSAGLTRRLGLPPSAPGLAGRIARTGVAAALSGLAAWATQREVAELLGSEVPRHSFPALFAAIGVAGALYLVLARVLGLPEGAELLQRLARLAGRR
jgi:peptidoglycan biosynthesis protein MviN/MurJ (putative lipid II flippase)